MTCTLKQIPTYSDLLLLNCICVSSLSDDLKMDLKIEISEDFDFVERCCTPIDHSADCKLFIKKEDIAECRLETTPIKIKSELVEIPDVEADCLPPELILCKEEPLFFKPAFHNVTSVPDVKPQNNQQENAALYPSQDTENGKNKQLSSVESNRICKEETSSADLVKKNCAAARKRKTNNCTVCNKSFTVQRDLEKHYLTHESKGLHKCGICNKRFTRKHSLKLHHLSHKDQDKQYKCDICNKKFKLVNSLRRHVSIHNCKLLFRCGMCNNKYIRMDQFERHNLVHEGKGQYKCEISDK